MMLSHVSSSGAKSRA